MSATLAVERPVGAPADVCELEYCNALLQTEYLYLRANATLTPHDIQALLVSRHGVYITEGCVERQIFQQLAGCSVVPTTGEEEDDDDNDDGDNDDDDVIGDGKKGENNDNEGNDIPDLETIKESVSEQPAMNASGASGDTSKDHGERDSGATTVTAANGAVQQQQQQENKKNGDASSQATTTTTTQPMDLVQLVSLLFIPELHVILSLGGHATAEDAGDLETGKGDEKGKKNNEDVILMYESLEMIFEQLVENAQIVTGTPLTASVLARLLMVVGEVHHWSEHDLEMMIRHAAAATGTAIGPPCLTFETFLKCLTSDTRQLADMCHPNRPFSATTLYQDALNSKTTTTNEDQQESSSKTTTETTSIYASSLPRIPTCSNIDFTADTFECLTWSVLAWYTFSLVFFCYLLLGRNGGDFGFRFVSLGCDARHAEDTLSFSFFACMLGDNIIKWTVTFFYLAIIGTPFMVLTTLGNSAYLGTAAMSDHASFGGCIRLQLLPTLFSSAIGIAAVFCLAILSYPLHIDLLIFDTSNIPSLTVGYILLALVGGTLLFMQLRQFFRILLLLFPCRRIITNKQQQAQGLERGSSSSPSTSTQKSPRRRELAFQDASFRERITKKAASYKVGRLLQNALNCHFPGDTNLRTRRHRHRDALKTIASVSALNADGQQQIDNKGPIMPHEKSMALFHYLVESEKRETVGGVWWAWKSILTGAIFSEEGIWFSPRLISSNLTQLVVFAALCVNWFFVEQRTQSMGLGLTPQLLTFVNACGALSGIFTDALYAVIFLPSSISTILKFRAGIIGSLREKDFLECRFAPDQSTIIFGSALWASLFTSVVCWLVVGGLIFLVANKLTRPIMYIVLTNILGFSATFILKWIILRCARKSWYRGMYRVRPAAANLMMVIMECWNLALTTGYVVVRIAKLLIITLYRIGRIDTPFLAPGVGYIFGKIHLDAHYIAFRKELLAHEAHRHPFIERLSFLFLVKLRNGKEFGTPAGAAWRVFFTLMLMPWMQRYRLRSSGMKNKLKSLNITGPKSYGELYSENKALEMELEMLRAENGQLKDKIRTKERGESSGSFRGFSSAMSLPTSMSFRMRRSPSKD